MTRNYLKSENETHHKSKNKSKQYIINIKYKKHNHSLITLMNSNNSNIKEIDNQKSIKKPTNSKQKKMKKKLSKQNKISPAQKSASCVLIGTSMTGKSTLGNTLIGRNVFKVNDYFKSGKNKIIGQFGIFEKRKVFIVDTPGFGKENQQDYFNILTQYVNKENIQSFVVVVNFMTNSLDENVIRLFQLINQMYPQKKWLNHIAIVWTNYLSVLPESIKETSRVKQEVMKEMIQKRIVPEITDEELNSIPQYFVDSLEARNNNHHSKEQLNDLLNWISNQEPIMKSQELIDVNNLNNNENNTFSNYFIFNSPIVTNESNVENNENQIQNETNKNMIEIINEEIETKQNVISDTTELNIRTIETAEFERIKSTLQSGKIVYSEWKEKENTRKKEKKVIIQEPKQIIHQEREKEEIVGTRREVDQIVRYGPKRYLFFGERRCKKEKGRIIQKRKVLKEQRTIEVFEDGKTNEGEWKVISEKENEEEIETFGNENNDCVEMANAYYNRVNNTFIGGLVCLGCAASLAFL